MTGEVVAADEANDGLITRPRRSRSLSASCRVVRIKVLRHGRCANVSVRAPGLFSRPPAPSWIAVRADCRRQWDLCAVRRLLRFQRPVQSRAISNGASGLSPGARMEMWSPGRSTVPAVGINV